MFYRRNFAQLNTALCDEHSWKCAEFVYKPLLEFWAQNNSAGAQYVAVICNHDRLPIFCNQSNRAIA